MFDVLTFIKRTTIFERRDSFVAIETKSSLGVVNDCQNWKEDKDCCPKIFNLYSYPASFAFKLLILIVWRPIFNIIFFKKR